MVGALCLGVKDSTLEKHLTNNPCGITGAAYDMLAGWNQTQCDAKTSFRVMYTEFQHANLQQMLNFLEHFSEPR